MNNQIPTPINRVNKFFSESDFQLETDFGKEALEGDMNLRVVLYRVDRTKTQVMDRYGEADEDQINYHEPIDLPVATYKINATENKAYNAAGGTLRYAQNGQLVFKVFNKTLKELNIELTYGDFIGFDIDENTRIFYAIVDNGLKNFDNQHSLMGYKGYYMTVTCAAIDNNEFSGK
jgi:hypothetical protein